MYTIITFTVILIQVHTQTLVDYEYSGCTDEYLFISTFYSQPDADATCQSRGYDGLAVIIQSHQLQDINIIISTVTKGLASTGEDALWIGYEYYGPDRLDWKWKRNGTWLNETAMFDIPWDVAGGEPDKTNQTLPDHCARVLLDPGLITRFVWRSVSCTARMRYPLCQRKQGEDKLNINKNEGTMMLVNSEAYPPTNQPSLPTRSLLECQVLCIKQCKCLGTYYHGNTCYIATDIDNSTLYTTGYYKMYFKQIYLPYLDYLYEIGGGL